MTREEFTKRTGFEPCSDYFDDVIHRDYMNCDLNKDEFCAKWKRNSGVQKAYQSMRFNYMKAAAKWIHYRDEYKAVADQRNKLQSEVMKLRAELRELQKKEMNLCAVN